MAAFTKSCSLTKNLMVLADVKPKPVITWDMHERIKRNKEIWDNPESIVHRLPKHYQHRYWNSYVLARRTPVHYNQPKFRFYYDKKRLVELETEEYPILPEYCPEQDMGLWGGEGVIKGYHESNAKLKKKILPRQWVPSLWFPKIKTTVFYSEILDKYMKIMLTERVHRLIDIHFGLDFYLLETPDIDINSKLGMDLKRQILITLAKQNYHRQNQEKHEYIKAKYANFVIPLEEAEWHGFSLNEACRKQQDLEDNTAPRPLKYVFEEELVRELKEETKASIEVEEEEEEEPQKIEGPTPLPPNKWVGWRV